MKITKFKPQSFVLKAADFRNNLLSNKVKLSDGRIGTIKNVDAKTYYRANKGIFFAFGAYIELDKAGSTVITPNAYGDDDLVQLIKAGKFTFLDRHLNDEFLADIDEFIDQFVAEQPAETEEEKEDDEDGGPRIIDDWKAAHYDDLTNNPIPFTRDFQDWLSTRAAPVNVTVPSKLLKPFRKVYHTEPTKVVDSDRKTSGGYSMKFNISAVCRLADPNEDIPENYKKYFKEGTTEIHNTGALLKAIREGDLTIATK